MTVLRLVPAVLALFALAAPSTARAQSATLESLLSDSGLDYAEVSDGLYRVSIAEGLGVPVLVSLQQLGRNRLVYMVTGVLRLPESGGIPGGLYREVASINAEIPVGSVAISDQARAVIFSTSVWFDIATPELLRRQLSLVDGLVRRVRTVLEPHLAVE